MPQWWYTSPNPNNPLRIAEKNYRSVLLGDCKSSRPKTNLLPPIPLPFIQQQQQQQQFWSFEEKLAAETVANLVAPGDFINGSDCAIFSLFDKAITHHTVAKPLQETDDKKKKKKTTQTLLNLQDKSESIFNKEKDEIYYKIKQTVDSRLQIE